MEPAGQVGLKATVASAKAAAGVLWEGVPALAGGV